jgi:DNA polymerase-3 subunit gamma/tau
MSELSLYRKYRPQEFDEVLGQEHIVKALKSAIKEEKISHAYLFSGGRGTGKTSVARIFAKAIGTSNNDLYEMDAASNRGIDEVRALKEAVLTLPFESKYKVYIVDETHMMTKEAFNALLKTLEEPPSHVIFILATTEPDRLPETILSRCQHFMFKKPNHAILKQMVEKVAKKEGFEIEKEAVDLIVVLGDGSFRDTHGVLQKAISLSKKNKITEEDVVSISGAPKKSLVQDFILALAGGEVSKALSVINDVEVGNFDFKVFLNLVIEKIRQIMILRFAPELIETKKQEFSEEDFKFIQNLSGKGGENITSKTLSRFLVAQGESARSDMPAIPLEIAVIELVDRKLDK